MKESKIPNEFDSDDKNPNQTNKQPTSLNSPRDSISDSVKPKKKNSILGNWKSKFHIPNQVKSKVASKEDGEESKEQEIIKSPKFLKKNQTVVNSQFTYFGHDETEIENSKISKI